MDTKSTLVNRDVRLLSPWFSEKLAKAVAACNKMGYPIAAFECWRSPERQDWLYAQGRTREGKIVTKAKSWESMHQFSLACDVALFEGGKWSWEFDPAKITPFFLAEGLVSLAPFENAHFQAKTKMTVQAMRNYVVKYGLQQLWMETENDK